MKTDRRGFLTTAGLSLAAFSLIEKSGFAARGNRVKVGMCDWNLGGSCNPDLIPKAKEAHLEGIQVSVGSNPHSIPLRHPKVRQKYIDLGKKYGITFHSVAAGSILNRIPLKSEPESAVYVIDALEAAAALGSTNILMAFFGRGDLRYHDNMGNLNLLQKEPTNIYELDQRGVDRVVAALKQIVPRAEDLGIALGLENTITAKQNLEIIEEVGSDIVQVYYDVGNSTNNGYDVPGEIRMLGNDRICEIHLKDYGTRVLGSPKGHVDFQAVAEACEDIGYDKWFVLETSGRDKHFMEDTRANVAFAKKTFA